MYRLGRGPRVRGDESTRAPKGRYLVSLGREPQEENLKNMEEPQSGDRLFWSQAEAGASTLDLSPLRGC